MKPKARFPIKHISIRVPWHDNGWAGSICKKPKDNTACLKLENIAHNKSDEKEEALAGRLLSDIPEKDWPPCISERATFMASFALNRTVVHPYSKSSPKTHGHLLPTELRFPPYSAPAVPFFWMRKEHSEDLARAYGLDFDFAREPKLEFEKGNKGWVQEYSNQKSLLDGFFDHFQADSSLCFFYAKQVPFYEGQGRVLIGVGRIKSVGNSFEYKSNGKSDFRCMPWERLISHSIRPAFDDGFILPYHQLFDLSQKQELDLANYTVVTPDEGLREFSFSSEHVTHDSAISALLKCRQALLNISKLIDGPWEKHSKWIDARLAEIWNLRGAFPGLGSALSAFGVSLGNLVAWEISNLQGADEDLWQVVDQVFLEPDKFLSKELVRHVGASKRDAWKELKPKRKALLKLLSRFELSPSQAEIFYIQSEKERIGIVCTDDDILNNPYILYEASRHTSLPIDLWTIDKGLFPPDSVLAKNPIAAPSAIEGDTDPRRVRALSVHTLELASASGNTMIFSAKLIESIRDLPIDPACKLTEDILPVVDRNFEPLIHKIKSDLAPGYQLARLSECKNLIVSTIQKRVEGKRNIVNANWANELTVFLKEKATDAQEVRARQEKSAALKELAESRFSVLIGPAGTGKTTLLSILCNNEAVKAGGVLMLAPTGKARVRMEQSSGVRSQTLAQFLSSCGRFEGKTQRYILTDSPPIDAPKTVIIDESSMLTEEMLAALLQSLKGVHRLILVGDPNQLPPIGPGRPFLDIVTYLRSDQTIDCFFPKVMNSYAELTIARRQLGDHQNYRPDIEIAKWFKPGPVRVDADEVFSILNGTSTSEHLAVKVWNSTDMLRKLLVDTLVEELKLKSREDENGFSVSLGGSANGDYVYFNRGAASAIENWQILSPVRGMPYGVREINRTIHKQFRKSFSQLSKQWGSKRKIPQPFGPEEIVYGEKVINIRNHPRKETPGGYKLVWPFEDALGYVANGELGIVTNCFDVKKPPTSLKVEFCSQGGFLYQYSSSDLGDETRDPILELAYGLTVHKCQGSEFGLVIFILPEKCSLISRELLYTALTRQKNRIVILSQGPLADIKKYSSEFFSESAKRITNLFFPPHLVQTTGGFLEDRLIHRATNGQLLRSKSELLIYERLLSAGVKPTYEKPVRLGSEIRYPDFSIEDDDSGEVVIWEHCGLVDNPEYKEKWEKKLALFVAHGYGLAAEGGGPNGSLIVTEEVQNQGISLPQIDSIINRYIKWKS